ncbi:MAG: hypothetical protein UY03_C0024G0010 [Parcubacteria group bacterium GW2011_GWA2_47_64]|nr:MAG: hypothetical protein UY03_C0024G0010 [Parcubacteria group bacterium GW2011_GWA2_47_64]KKU97021.1 MAG: hypothetical protein UY29_C0003G0018 [Parcubacteria group bacterium GW2011_GWC2_48_17]
MVSDQLNLPAQAGDPAADSLINQVYHRYRRINPICRNLPFSALFINLPVVSLSNPMSYFKSVSTVLIRISFVASTPLSLLLFSELLTY